jgi:hypothetical protein
MDDETMDGTPIARLGAQELQARLQRAMDADSWGEVRLYRLELARRLDSLRDQEQAELSGEGQETERRRRKPRGEKRAKTFLIKLTQAEYETLRARAEAAGMAMSGYMRCGALSYRHRQT